MALGGRVPSPWACCVRAGGRALTPSVGVTCGQVSVFSRDGRNVHSIIKRFYDRKRSRARAADSPGHLAHSGGPRPAPHSISAPLRREALFFLLSASTCVPWHATHRPTPVLLEGPWGWGLSLPTGNSALSLPSCCLRWLPLSPLHPPPGLKSM